MYYNYSFPDFTVKLLSRATGVNRLLLEILIFLPTPSYFVYYIQVYTYTHTYIYKHTLLRILDYYNLMLTIE